MPESKLFWIAATFLLVRYWEAKNACKLTSPMDAFKPDTISTPVVKLAGCSCAETVSTPGQAPVDDVPMTAEQIRLAQRLQAAADAVPAMSGDGVLFETQPDCALDPTRC